jgi:hypothetical protein
MRDNTVKSTFEKWLQDIFVESEDTTLYDPNSEHVWYDFDENPEIEVEYILRLFTSPVEYTNGYSDEQINKMLWCLINESSPHLYHLLDDKIPFDLRVQVVNAMYIVYEKLFVTRCSNGTTAWANEETTKQFNPLNSICYMWWDIIPLYGKSGNRTREKLDSYCLDVMERILQLNSIACQESALHGLGHWQNAYPKRVKRIIDEYLKREIDNELREYARQACTGMIL